MRLSEAPVDDFLSDDSRCHVRLAYMVPAFPSQTHAFFWREITAMRQLGCEVFLISTSDPGPDACRHIFADVVRTETNYLLPLTTKDFFNLVNKPRQIIDVCRYAASLAETPLLKRSLALAVGAAAIKLNAFCHDQGIGHLHVHSCGNCAHIAALARLMGGPPYSLTLHGDLPVYGTDHAQKMKGARFISVVTQPLKMQVMETTGRKPADVPVITMGVDTDKFVGKRNYDTNGPVRLITVARLSRTKGHCFALEAMRKACDGGHDLRYTIVGEGDHKAEIEAYAQSLNLIEKVEFKGTVSEEEVRTLLIKSDIFLLTSFGLGEAAPVSVMEAMACGLPVISSRIGGTADMIRDGTDGLLSAPGDANSVYNALMNLLRSPDRRRALGEAARKKARITFDFRTTSHHLLEHIIGSD